MVFGTKIFPFLFLHKWKLEKNVQRVNFAKIIFPILLFYAMKFRKKCHLGIKKNIKFWTKKFNFLYFWTTLVIFWIPLDTFLNNFWSPKLKNFGASKKFKKEFIKFKNFAIFSNFYDFQKCNFLYFLVFKNLPYLDHFFW